MEYWNSLGSRSVLFIANMKRKRRKWLGRYATARRRADGLLQPSCRHSFWLWFLSPYMPCIMPKWLLLRRAYSLSWLISQPEGWMMPIVRNWRGWGLCVLCIWMRRLISMVISRHFAMERNMSIHIMSSLSIWMFLVSSRSSSASTVLSHRVVATSLPGSFVWLEQEQSWK